MRQTQQPGRPGYGQQGGGGYPQNGAPYPQQYGQQYAPQQPYPQQAPQQPYPQQAPSAQTPQQYQPMPQAQAKPDNSMGKPERDRKYSNDFIDDDWNEAYGMNDDKEYVGGADADGMSADQLADAGGWASGIGEASTAGWILYLFLSRIPLVGQLLLLMWGFSSSSPTWKKTWARAELALLVITVVLAMAAGPLLGNLVEPLLSDGLPTP